VLWAAGVNFHGGGDGNGYTPIANSTSAVVGVRPEFYGITFFTLAGQGTLYTTQLSAGSLNVTAYAVKSASGGLNIVIVNKDPAQNISLTASLPQSFSKASLIEMTQVSPGASGPSLFATSDVTIQDASINVDGTFSPAASYDLSLSSAGLQFYAPALSAVLVSIS